ncbi:MAG: hypothetical protein JSR21_22835, partial [Proteobacteria bacterium]|nr:hypothetical protein [Pseudomonadota bacterium]
LSPADAAKLPPLPAPGAGPDRGPALAMPKDAAPGPAAFAEGVWRSRSGLLLNGKPAEEYYRFDKSGQGDVTLRTRDGAVQCTGPAQVAVGANRQLTFKEAPTLSCSDGSSVTGALTTCAPGAGGASCQGTNTSDGSKFDVRIEGVKSP